MTAPREALAQAGPPPLSELQGFPVRRLTEGRTVYRAHRGAAAPWWFGSDGRGRFDLPRPRGTCYLADSALVALRERLGTILGGAAELPASLIDGVVVSKLELPGAADVANLRSAVASRFGVLRELEVMVPYTLPQAWARALVAAGHDGIAYGARFTPGRAGAIALFGAAGPRATWRQDPHPMPAGEVRGAPVRLGPPRRAQLTVIRPPRTGGPYADRRE